MKWYYPLPITVDSWLLTVDCWPVVGRIFANGHPSVACGSRCASSHELALTRWREAIINDNELHTRPAAASQSALPWSDSKIVIFESRLEFIVESWSGLCARLFPKCTVSALKIVLTRCAEKMCHCCQDKICDLYPIFLSDSYFLRTWLVIGHNNHEPSFIYYVGGTNLHWTIRTH